MRFHHFLSWILFTTLAIADPLDTWIWRNPLPTGNIIRGIGYGGGRFVAVGDRETVLISTDSTNWVDRSLNTTNTFGNVAYGNGRFVAVGGTLPPSILGFQLYQNGGPAIITSTDGTNWNSVNSGTEMALQAVAFGNGQFVAVGSDTILTSSDGNNWVKRGTNATGFFVGVAYGNGQFLITGSTNNVGVVWVSPDGVNWSPRPPLRISFGQVIFGSGIFLAQHLTNGLVGGLQTRLLASADGESWTNVLNTSVDPIFTHDGTKFVAIPINCGCASNRVYTSMNGFIWTSNIVSDLRLPTGLSSFPAMTAQLAYGGGSYFATPGVLFRSDNLTNWTGNRSSPLPIQAGRVLLSGKGKMILAGTGPILISTNGFDYKTNAATGTFSAGAFGTNTFILASGGGSIVTSTNGADWTTRTTGGSSINALAYGSNTFIAVGSNGDVRVSATGTGWSGRFSGTTLHLYGVAYGNGVYAAVGDSGAVLTSPDTINWTAQDAGTITTLRSLTFGNGVFVATGDNGTLRVSSDATSWSTINSGTTEILRSSAATRGALLVAGTSRVLSSLDGFNWQPHIVPLDVYSIGTTPNTFVLMGATTNIVESGVLNPITMFAPSYTLPGTFRVKVTGDVGTAARLQRLTTPSNWIDVLSYTNASVPMPLTVTGATNPVGIYRVVTP